MSIVRYKDPKSGRITLYESTSYYDPVLKQSRPKRKYLGTEDESGNLIPSSGKPGRRRKQMDDNPLCETSETISRTQYNQLLEIIDRKDAELAAVKEKLKAASSENCELKKALQRVQTVINPFLSQ